MNIVEVFFLSIIDWGKVFFFINGKGRWEKLLDDFGKLEIFLKIVVEYWK